MLHSSCGPSSQARLGENISDRDGQYWEQHYFSVGSDFVDLCSFLAS